MSFLAAGRAGLGGHTHLHDLGLLEHRHHRWAAVKTLDRLGELLGLQGREEHREERIQFLSDALLRRRDRDEIARALVVTRAVAERADHVVRCNCRENIRLESGKL